ncbi:hypothetical protein Syun_029912 [Stephania yunnanensis]|uniref:Uncharacterized protein n=1 Tax=Stephania yunnanensis TaxID=152371 RepID=A0AAP0EE30_9MAGN
MISDKPTQDCAKSKKPTQDSLTNEIPTRENSSSKPSNQNGNVSSKSGRGNTITLAYSAPRRCRARSLVSSEYVSEIPALWHEHSIKTIDVTQVSCSSGLNCIPHVITVAAGEAKLQRRRLELTQATPDQSVDDEAVYLNVAGECPKGRVYGLGSLGRKKRRYADPGANTSQMPEMVPRAEIDIVVEQLRKVMAFMHQQFGMTMDGAGLSQPQPPPPPPPPPSPHDQQQPQQIDPADPPQQQDNVEQEMQDCLTRDEQLGDT